MKYMQLHYFTELRMKLSALNTDTNFQIPNPQMSLLWKPSLARRLNFLLVQEIHSLLKTFFPNFSLHTFQIEHKSPQQQPGAPQVTRRSPERAEQPHWTGGNCSAVQFTLQHHKLPSAPCQASPWAPSPERWQVVTSVLQHPQGSGSTSQRNAGLRAAREKAEGVEQATKPWRSAAPHNCTQRNDSQISHLGPPPPRGTEFPSAPAPLAR